MTTATTDYTKMTRPQLVALLGERGLATTGNLADLIGRLQLADDPARVFDTPDEPPPAPTAPPAGPTSVPTPVNPHMPTVEHRGKVVIATHPCVGELSTGMHEMFVRLTYDLATAQGHHPRGGLLGANSAHFVGWTEVAGIRHAKYEIPVR